MHRARVAMSREIKEFYSWNNKISNFFFFSDLHGDRRVHLPSRLGFAGDPRRLRRSCVQVRF